MIVEQLSYDAVEGWFKRGGDLGGRTPDLVLVFGGRELLESVAVLEQLREVFPKSRVVIASTAGEMIGTDVDEGTLAVTAIAFDKTRVECAATEVRCTNDSYAAGRSLAEQLARPDLVHVFVVSDGSVVNGTELARGFNEHLPAGALLTGGLAGDGTRFERTVVGLDADARARRVVAVGFYGTSLRVKFGSAGGWEPFGPLRAVTRSEGNTLYELDGQSALGLYRKYLGDQADKLPASAFRFPLAVTADGSVQAVVRTILSINEAAESMTFAGDIPTGAQVRFMRASYEDLIDGAAAAAEHVRDDGNAQLVVCVSCVGRRIVLGQRVEEETEIVRSVVGPGPAITGFYSYGELAPASSTVACQLHNQTMTVTSFREV